MALKQGRTARALKLLRNGELDFQLMRALSAATEGGATVGECLLVRDQAGSPEAFARAWFALAARTEQRANAALEAGHQQTGLERLKRATNYYKSALTNFSPIAHAEEHRESWASGTRTFERFGSLLATPMARIDVPFEGGVLPCYWLRPDSTAKPAPSLMAFTGGEGSAMEMYFWIGAAGARRGYNVFLCEIPGNVGAMYRNDLRATLRPDTEKPIGAIIDHIAQLPGIDPKRIAATGYSYGGYFAARAACFDSRIAALIPDTPLRNGFELWYAVMPRWFMNSRLGPELLNWVATTLLRRANRNSVDLVLWLKQAENMLPMIEFTRQCNLTGLESQIKCPVLALDGDGEGEIFNRQAKEFFDAVGSQRKQMVSFLSADGGGAHCQVDNYSLLQEVTYDWLDEVFGAAP